MRDEYINFCDNKFNQKVDLKFKYRYTNLHSKHSALYIYSYGSFCNVLLCCLLWLFHQRIASLSKIFPTLMLYKLWEDGKVDSLDDPLGKYVKNFSIKNPLGKRMDHDLKSVSDGMSSREAQVHVSSVTLRRMASQLSGEDHSISN